LTVRENDERVVTSAWETHGTDAEAYACREASAGARILKLNDGRREDADCLHVVINKAKCNRVRGAVSDAGCQTHYEIARFKQNLPVRPGADTVKIPTRIGNPRSSDVA